METSHDRPQEKRLKIHRDRRPLKYPTIAKKTKSKLGKFMQDTEKQRPLFVFHFQPWKVEHVLKHYNACGKQHGKVRRSCFEQYLIIINLKTVKPIVIGCVKILHKAN